METQCRHCQAQLSRDEYFWFDDACLHCERFMQITSEERNLSVKSPLYIFYAMHFHTRRLRHKFSACLRNSNML